MKRTALVCALILVALIAPAAAAAKGFTPKPTMADEMAATKVTFAPGYLDTRPRLLFGPADRPAIKQKVAAGGDLWKRVIRQAQTLGKYVPTPQQIRDAGKYWRIEYVLSGAMAYDVTGNKAYRDNTVKWMIAHCAEDVWGTGYGSNVDLHASWYLYYISLAYDILHDTLSDAERNAIRAGLISHAQAIYESKLPPQEYRFDQNHTYIPSTALAAASLALAGEVPQTARWLKLSTAMMNRSRYALGNDGYYYESTGYWQYAMHWHVRYADLATRAFGGSWYDLPTLRNNWLFPLYMSVPGSPFMWDIGDGGSGAQKRPTSASLSWNHMLYRLASVHDDGRIQAAADRLVATREGGDDPAMWLLWYAPEVKPADLTALPPYHHFKDHDVITWRSGWDDDATCMMFKAGPPQGHAAAAKLKQMTDWKMNSGHVHPDIGAFWIFAGGEYLAVDTGYTAAKRTDDHNTLLVDGVGQGVDNYYWVYRGLPYKLFDNVRITKSHLTKDYGYAAADIGSAYVGDGSLGKLNLTRHVAMTKRFMLIVDDLAGAKPHQYTWLMHTDTPITAKGKGKAFESTKGDMRLLTYALAPGDVTPTIGPTMVNAGRAPGKGDPTQRGYQLQLQTPGKVAKTRFVTLLLPLATDQPAPRRVRLARNDQTGVVIRIHWPDKAPQIVTLKTNWDGEDRNGPLHVSEQGLDLPPE